MAKDNKRKNRIKADNGSAKTGIQNAIATKPEAKKALIKRKVGAPYKYSLDNGVIDISRINGLVNTYIESATQKNMFSLAGLAIALNIDMSTLALWEKGYTKKPDIDEKTGELTGLVNYELSGLIKKAKTYILQWLVESTNSQRQAKDIFLLKNWFGYTDTSPDEVKNAIQINIDMGKYADLSR